MKQKSSGRKTARKTGHTARRDTSAGPKGIAIAPPAYGIDIVDHESVEAVPEPGQKNQSPEATGWSVHDGSIQRRSAVPGDDDDSRGQHQRNRTGLPDNLKAGIETLSGLSLDDVKVHYNSAEPAQLQALAYTQGPDIHLASGQEKHLPHEAWHVLQQKQGRVKPTMQIKGRRPANDDPRLEKEADVMSAKALQMQTEPERSIKAKPKNPTSGGIQPKVAQLMKASVLDTILQESATPRGAAQVILLALGDDIRDPRERSRQAPSAIHEVYGQLRDYKKHISHRIQTNAKTILADKLLGSLPSAPRTGEEPPTTKVGGEGPQPPAPRAVSASPSADPLTTEPILRAPADTSPVLTPEQRGLANLEFYYRLWAEQEAELRKWKRAKEKRAQLEHEMDRDIAIRINTQIEIQKAMRRIIASLPPGVQLIDDPDPVARAREVYLTRLELRYPAPIRRPPLGRPRRAALHGGAPGGIAGDQGRRGKWKKGDVIGLPPPKKSPEKTRAASSSSSSSYSSSASSSSSASTSPSAKSKGTKETEKEKEGAKPKE